MQDFLVYGAKTLLVFPGWNRDVVLPQVKNKQKYIDYSMRLHALNGHVSVSSVGDVCTREYLASLVSFYINRSKTKHVSF